MTDNPTIIETGNNIDGTQSLFQTGSQDYSLSQTYEHGLATLTETGAKPYTITGSDAANTGDSTRTDIALR